MARKKTFLIIGKRDQSLDNYDFVNFQGSSKAYIPLESLVHLVFAYVVI